MTRNEAIEQAILACTKSVSPRFYSDSSSPTIEEDSNRKQSDETRGDGTPLFAEVDSFGSILSSDVSSSDYRLKKTVVDGTGRATEK